MELEKEKTRKFGGKLSGFKNRSEANNEKKHLKAYLAGHKMFTDGFFTDMNGIRRRRIYPVLEIWS